MKIKKAYLKGIIRQALMEVVRDSGDPSRDFDKEAAMWENFYENGPVHGAIPDDAHEFDKKDAIIFSDHIRKMVEHAEAVIEKEEWYSGPDYAAFFRTKEEVHHAFLGRAGRFTHHQPPRRHGSPWFDAWKSWGTFDWGTSKGPQLWEEPTRFFRQWLGE